MSWSPGHRLDQAVCKKGERKPETCLKCSSLSCTFPSLADQGGSLPVCQGLPTLRPDHHFQVQTGVLGKMSVCITVFGSKHRSDFEDTSKVSGYRHLLCKLWTLGKECRSRKVVHLEYFGSRLGRSGL